jgi:RimJ/RimL family protein N-acetyltransferase
MDKFIVNPIKLKFDPKGNKISEELKSVFENKLARTLWMGIKQRHITDQYFEDSCLGLAKLIEIKGAPDSAEKLEYMIDRYFGRGYSKEFISELLPYLSGEKNLEYEVVK